MGIVCISAQYHIAQKLQFARLSNEWHERCIGARQKDLRVFNITCRRDRRRRGNWITCRRICSCVPRGLSSRCSRQPYFSACSSLRLRVGVRTPCKICEREKDLTTKAQKHKEDKKKFSLCVSRVPFGQICGSISRFCKAFLVALHRTLMWYLRSVPYAYKAAVSSAPTSAHSHAAP